MKFTYLVILFTLVTSSLDLHAFDSSIPTTFDSLCKRDTTGYPADPDIVNCWDFEREEDIVYRDVSQTCKNPDGTSVLSFNPNSLMTQTPYQNASINNETCMFPHRTAEYATSGKYSMKIQQPPNGGGNGGGTFFPYFKYRLDNGKYKIAAFGKGAELWIRWRYRQNEELFNYHSKRFMVTHQLSYWEHVLVAMSNENFQIREPPYKFICAYNNKGLQGYGCSNTTFFEANKWHTIVMHIIVPNNAESNNGTFELFIDGKAVSSHVGNVWTPKSVPDFPVGYTEDLDWDTYKDVDALMRLDFTLFENGKNRPDNPYAQYLPSNRGVGVMYIDDVMVTRKRPPEILPSGVDADTTPPPPPTNIRARID